jgi:hypothetical protein
VSFRLLIVIPFRLTVGLNSFSTLIEEWLGVIAKSAPQTKSLRSCLLAAELLDKHQHTTIKYLPSGTTAP